MGAEHVLEGFDEGVATMRQGERALLKLSPDVAYGSVGARDEMLNRSWGLGWLGVDLSWHILQLCGLSLCFY